MRRRLPLTARGVGALALAIACAVLAFALAIEELLYVAVLLGLADAAAVATLFLVRRSDRVSRVLHPDVAAVGDEIEVHVQVEVRSTLPTTPGRWREQLDPGLAPVDGGAFPAVPSGLGARRLVALSYRTAAVTRGVRVLGPLHVSGTDAFSLARRHFRLGGGDTVTVAPATVPLRPLPDRPGAAGGVLRSDADHFGQGADNLIPRSYQPGDSMRRIHWRASAHRGELMVREEEQEATPTAVVVLDLSTRRYGDAAAHAPGGDPGFETALSAAVSVVTRLVHDGYTVTVLDADGEPLAPGLGEAIDAAEPGALEDLIIAAATLVARPRPHAPGDSDVSALRRAFAGATTGPLVMITGRLSSRDVDLLPALAAHAAVPVLLSVDVDTPVASHLNGQGWLAASLPAGGDVAAAWERALGATDGAHDVVG